MAETGWWDLGDVVPLTINVRDANGALANATSVTLTITLPDGTTASPSVTNPSTGVYQADYTPGMVGRFVWKMTASGTNAGVFTDTFTVSSYEPLVSIGQAVSYLGTGYVSADEPRLRDVIMAATELIERRRPIRRRSQTYTANGGQGAVFLPWLPIVSITSVTEDGVTLSASDYKLAAGGILYRGQDGSGTWAAGVANVVVTAVVGYAEPPRLAVEACLEQVRHMWESRRGGAARGGRFGGAEDGYIPGSAHFVTYRVAEMLDALDPANDLPGFA